MKKIHFIFLLIIGGLVGCQGNNIAHTGFKEIRDSGITIQLMKLTDSIPDISVIKYGVRIFPDKALLTNMTAMDEENLLYRMDSTFYLQSNSKKYYPSLTEPIANGQKNNFEYLLIFKKSQEMKLKDMFLAFNDKYISHKTHHLQLNSN